MSAASNTLLESNRLVQPTNHKPKASLRKFGCVVPHLERRHVSHRRHLSMASKEESVVARVTDRKKSSVVRQENKNDAGWSQQEMDYP
jgi:hypothetical protein